MSQQKLSRRDLLKLIAAATGATIISSVPYKWQTPIVEFGALPAHAQGSATGTISGYVYLDDCNPASPIQSSRIMLASTNGICPVPLSGSPLPGINIAVQGYPNLNFTTGQDGHYVISNVPAGIRCLQVSGTTAPNKAQSPSGTCPTVPAGGTVCVNILLCRTAR